VLLNREVSPMLDLEGGVYIAFSIVLPNWKRIAMAWPWIWNPGNAHTDKNV